MSPSILDAIDSVYFLMFPGWKNELRSNRWHYAKRWARHRAVVLVQPDQPKGRFGIPEPELRIPNCTILSVRRPSGGSQYEDDPARTASQLAKHMLDSGHRRPLLWFYNPWLFPAFAALPAVARVYHASENYFDFEGTEPYFTKSFARALALADRVIAVSSGVARGITENVPESKVIEVPNGCDYEEYAQGRPSPTLASRRAGFSRIAIYAGFVNDRIDFELFGLCAARFSDTLFVVYGPVVGLDGADEARWNALLERKNVRYFGRVDPAELPHLYAAAEVGLIPYKRTPMIENNGFPLKALEMTATGLPVVSTYMRPLEAIEDVIALGRDHEGFLELLRDRSRSTLTTEQRARMEARARERDYEAAFARVLDELSSLGAGSPRTRLDALAETIPSENLLASIVRFGEPCSATVERCMKSAAVGAFGRARQAAVKRWIPG